MTLKDISPRAGFFWLVAALVLIISSRMSSLGVAAWNMDEGVTAAIAEVIADGGVPYRDVVDHRGPATYYVYAAWFRLVGGNGLEKMQSLQVALGILVAGLAIGVYFLGEKLGGRRIGALAVFWFVVITSNGWPGDLRAFHTEWVLAFGSLVGVLLLWRALPTRNLWLLFCSGVFFGFAFTAKQPAVMDMLAAGCLIAFDILVPNGNSSGNYVRARWATLIKCTVVTAAGFLLVPLILAVYLYSQGAWTDFLIWFWRYNTEFYMPMVSGADRLQSILTPWSSHMVLDNPLNFIPLGLGMLLGLALLASRRSGIVPLLASLEWPARIRLFAGLWLLLGWVAANLSGRDFGHYLIQMFVPLALISGITINSLLGLFAHWYAGYRKSTGREYFVGPLNVGLIVMAAAVVLAVNPFMKRPVEGWPQLAYLDLPETMPMDLANLLNEKTEPGDRIWVWGWLSSIYVLAERQSASRFVYCSFLSGLVPWVNVEEDPPLTTEYPGAWDMWEEDMKAHPPVYIVDMAVGDSHFWYRYRIEHYPRLKKFIADNYTEEGVFRVQEPDNGGSSPYFRIYRRNET
jgi:hypothetical protein